MSALDALQWPTMAVTVVAAWFVASSHKTKRSVGFWLFLLSNVGWIVWGLHAGAQALIVLQVCLAAMNIRGARKTNPEAAPPVNPPSPPGRVLTQASAPETVADAAVSPSSSPGTVEYSFNRL